MIYLDTSVVLSLITPEQHTEAARAWLSEQPAGAPAVSEWVLTEVASALSLQQRGGWLDDLGRARAHRIQERLLGELQVLPVRTASLRAAAQLCGRWQSGLCGSDALHIAVADEHRADICTRDRVQAEAAQQLGLLAVLLPEDAT